MSGTCLAVMGSGTAGKDTFYTLLATHLDDRICTRLALADSLKAELDPFFGAFGGTAFETDPVKKERQRPVLASYGETLHILTKGRHLIDKIEPHVLEALARGETIVITDCRYPVEVDWVKGLGGKAVYVERRLPDGSILPPINAKEAANDPYLRANADVFVSWPTILTERDGGSGSIHDLWIFVEKAAHQLNLIA